MGIFVKAVVTTAWTVSKRRSLNTFFALANKKSQPERGLDCKVAAAGCIIAMQ